MDLAIEKVSQLETLLTEIQQCRLHLAKSSSDTKTDMPTSTNQYSQGEPGPSGPIEVSLPQVSMPSGIAPIYTVPTCGTERFVNPIPVTAGHIPGTPLYPNPVPTGGLYSPFVSAPMSGRPMYPGYTTPSSSIVSIIPVSAPYAPHYGYSQAPTPGMPPLAPTPGMPPLAPTPGMPPLGHISDQRIRLPKMDLPTYNGDPYKWLEFWDTFSASVHNQMVPNVTKFQYLKSLLRGPAYSAIAGMAVTNENYAAAIHIIHSRFGDANVLKDALYSKLQNLPQASGEAYDLRNMADSLERIFRQLQSLGENVSQSYFLHLIYGKLHPSTLADLERMKNLNEMWTVDTLRQAIWDLVKIRERIQRASTTTYVEDESQPNYKYNEGNGQTYAQKSSTDSFLATCCPIESNMYNTHRPTVKPVPVQFTPKQPCLFCGGTHFHEDCKEVTTVGARKNELYGLHRCFLCLKQGHIAPNCDQPQRTCPHCQAVGHHNRALCPQRATADVSKTCSFVSSINPPQISEPAATVGEVFAPIKPMGVMVSHSFHVKPQQINTHVESTEKLVTNQNEKYQKIMTDVTKNSTCSAGSMSVSNTQINTMLLTAKVCIINPEDKSESATVDTLFDSGSQKTFLVADLADELKLSSKCEGLLSIHTFASNKPQCISSRIVQFQLYLQDGSQFEMKANVVPVLAGDLQKESLRPKDLDFLETIPTKYLADNVPRATTSFVPKLMIGIDYFFDLIKMHKRQQMPSGLHIIPSKVGLLIGGRQEAVNSTRKKIETCSMMVTTQMKQIQTKNVTATPVNQNVCNKTIAVKTDGFGPREPISSCPYENHFGRFDYSWIYDPTPRQFASRMATKGCQTYNNAQILCSEVPFQSVGLNYIGPLWVKVNGVFFRRTKVYICLFTCLRTRIIHMEIILSLNVSSFLGCLKRFIAINGKPYEITSLLPGDSQCSIAANDDSEYAWRELCMAVNISEYLSVINIAWRTTTELKPWYTNVYEHFIASLQMSITESILGKLFTYDELLTFLAEVSAMVNFRPLSAKYDGLTLKEIIRPAKTGFNKHHIIRITDSCIGDSKLESSCFALNYWKASQLYQDKFWQIWYESYLKILRKSKQTWAIHRGTTNENNLVPRVNDELS